MASREQRGVRAVTAVGAGTGFGPGSRPVATDHTLEPASDRSPASALGKPAASVPTPTPAPAPEAPAPRPDARHGLPDRHWLLQRLHERVPGLMAVHVFGSRCQGTARADSDLDLAVLVAGYADPILLFELASDLANELGHEVDLLDFRAASTVMQAQILMQGECWWRLDASVEAYEAAVLNDKLSLDAARAGLLADIQTGGRVYGR